jgi:aminoglycoside phosphotransferase family enzyme
MSALPEHLQNLLQPRAYPHPVRAVQLVETHISWILLTGEFAYKIKRPVHYPFVDLRSAERREFLCHEEVRLNRRFADELYLGVSQITATEGEARMDGSGLVIEHAVKMRQFRREDELDVCSKHCASGRRSWRHSDAISRAYTRSCRSRSLRWLYDNH